tara:strand:+ start:5173 stop:5823 length:651 start_codon:yes stop_codon:yes gene_type:complete
MAVRYIRRPVYTPEFKLETGLFTPGKEWMYHDTLEEYIGLYHRYPNKATYTEASWTSRSVPLIPLTIANSKADLISSDGMKTGITGSLNNTQYFQLTEKRFNNYYAPPYFYPDVTKEMYDVGFMPRFFAQRINDITDITEINGAEFDRKNENNKPGIDQGLYIFVKLDWSITGPIDDVRIVNNKVIQEKEKIMPGLSSYLSDLDEFHKNAHKIKEK